MNAIKPKKIFTRIMALLLTLFMTAFTLGVIAEAAGSGGLVTLTVTVTGLTDNSGIQVTAEKEIDGVLTYYRMDTNESGIAVFMIPFGGTVRVFGEPLSGYVTPEVTLSLTQLKGNLKKACTLEYIVSEKLISVTGVTVEPEARQLFVSDEVQLDATVLPLNATDRTAAWSSGNETVAIVSESGLVTAMAVGEALITATTTDGSFTGTCAVNVVAIASVNDPEGISAAPNSSTALTDTVDTLLTSGDPFTADVVWSLPADVLNASIATSNGIQYLTLTGEAADSFELLGNVEGTELTAKLMVTVLEVPVVPIVSGSLDFATLSLYLGLDRDTATLTLTVQPTGADTSSLLWRSSNEAVVRIVSVAADQLSAAVQGLTAGTAVISVVLPGEPDQVLDSCIVNVAADPLITDPAYISATMENSTEPVDQFSEPEEVYIRCYNLPDDHYYIRITDKGNRAPLGTGEIDVADATVEGGFKYNLWNATGGFELTASYSASYFVSMSTDPDFPSGDDEVTLLPKTFSDNFKITSPVPTGDINVTVSEVIGQDIASPSPMIVDRHVILCREIDVGTDAQYDDYVLYYDGDVPIFSDEAKMIGHVKAGGAVLWEEPKEKLKIGGYILLMELPEGYVSNLDLIDPDGEDGELVKEVHIDRSSVVFKHIIVSSSGMASIPIE